MAITRLYGLIGRNIAYSFSRDYFRRKFAAENNSNSDYVNFDIDDISQISEIIAKNKNLIGLNVTIPYKEAVIPLLDSVSENAREIGAVNTIKIRSGKLEGFNTDAYGFEKSITPLLRPHHKKALILGTGGASKAVAFTFKSLGIEFDFVSRNFSDDTIRYEDLQSVFDDYQIVVNTTPLGTFPNIEDCPNIPYELFTPDHIAYDLIYNPAETAFLKKAKAFGAATKNGLEMLELQAQKAWEIWNS